MQVGLGAGRPGSLWAAQACKASPVHEVLDVLALSLPALSLTKQTADDEAPVAR